MFPPPITMPTSTPNLTMSRTSWAICSSVFGEIPYFPSPISASPLSFRRMRLNLGGLVDAVTGRGSYLAPPGRSRRRKPERQSIRVVGEGLDDGRPGYPAEHLELGERPELPRVGAHPRRH